MRFRFQDLYCVTVIRKNQDWADVRQRTLWLVSRLMQLSCPEGRSAFLAWELTKWSWLAEMLQWPGPEAGAGPGECRDNYVIAQSLILGAGERRIGAVESIKGSSVWGTRLCRRGAGLPRCRQGLKRTPRVTDPLGKGAAVDCKGTGMCPPLPFSLLC